MRVPGKHEDKNVEAEAVPEVTTHVNCNLRVPKFLDEIAHTGEV